MKSGIEDIFAAVLGGEGMEFTGRLLYTMYVIEHYIYIFT